MRMMRPAFEAFCFWAEAPGGIKQLPTARHNQKTALDDQESLIAVLNRIVDVFFVIGFSRFVVCSGPIFIRFGGFFVI